MGGEDNPEKEDSLPVVPRDSESSRCCREQHFKMLRLLLA